MITVRYFAGARAATGVPEETIPLEAGLDSGATLRDLVTVLAERHGDRLAAVLGAASFLVDGVGCRDRDAPLPDTGVVDVLPPFAGG